MIVYKNSLVAYELTALCAGAAEAHTVDYVVKTGLEQTDEVVTGVALHLRGLDIVIVELTLKDAVHAACLLLLTKLLAVFG